MPGRVSLLFAFTMPQHDLTSQVTGVTYSTCRVLVGQRGPDTRSPFQLWLIVEKVLFLLCWARTGIFGNVSWALWHVTYASHAELCLICRLTLMPLL